MELSFGLSEMAAPIPSGIGAAVGQCILDVRRNRLSAEVTGGGREARMLKSCKTRPIVELTSPLPKAGHPRVTLRKRTGIPRTA